jgi:ADP-heptose:LPS heptosyltransferase
MRALDHTAGAVIVRLLAVRRRGKELPGDAKRIGVIIPTAIGDTILASGVIGALVGRYPAATIFIFHGKNNGPAVRLLPASVKAIQCDFANPLAAISMLRQQKLDMVLDLTPWTRVTAICARLAAPVAVGFDPVGQHRGLAFDVAVPHCTDRHESSNHAAFAALFSDQPYRMEVVTRRFDPPDGLNLDRLVLCHTSAGGTRAAAKAWAPDNWVRLAVQLAAKGWQVGFTGTAADAALVDTILDKAALPPHQALSLCGKVPLDQLGDLLKRVRLLITIDTGVLHLAAATNANVLALHGPTRSSRWGAKNVRATSLDSSHPAAGYILYGYEAHPDGNETMLSHTVEDVANTAFDKLNGSTSSTTTYREPVNTLISAYHMGQ